MVNWIDWKIGDTPDIKVESTLILDEGIPIAKSGVGVEKNDY